MSLICRGCGTRLKTVSALPGSKARCVKCGAIFVVPALPPSMPAPAVVLRPRAPVAQSAAAAPSRAPIGWMVGGGVAVLLFIVAAVVIAVATSGPANPTAQTQPHEPQKPEDLLPNKPGKTENQENTPKPKIEEPAPLPNPGRIPGSNENNPSAPTTPMPSEPMPQQPAQQPMPQQPMGNEPSPQTPMQVRPQEPEPGQEVPKPIQTRPETKPEPKPAPPPAPPTQTETVLPLPFEDVQKQLVLPDLSKPNPNINKLPPVAQPPVKPVMVPGEVAFMGVRAKGKRICIIADSSGSMSANLTILHPVTRQVMAKARNIDFLKQELLRTLKNLQADHQFYIILFDSKPEPMPFNRWVAGKDAAQVVPWINNIQPKGGTQPLPAFQLAFGLNPPPDVIFFMTDGKFNNNVGPTVAAANLQGPKIMINTIYFQSGTWPNINVNNNNGLQMAQIAQQNGGLFSFYPPPWGKQ